ncbi:MAG TPA: tRNA (adenosine(37)-N6)-threonylcarbamoyltransferase complex dimerization subunit type 1 TsaB [Candidatus Limnocylindrales bacterium]|nr:tRNA (adenosine(37)-N6)-threonylcarbamoyltransferase complex dimerization subunit type 1 TsaB [Candidatus Limnocylindrales bacterium]
MIILTLRTDKPEAEIGLYNDSSQLAHEQWLAHRQLAETLHKKISKLLTSQNLHLTDIEAIVCYEGPGSFTGLRIGLSVANALTYSLKVPIVGTTSDTWVQHGIEKLQAGYRQAVVLPEYGAEAHITLPKH